ncbi:MAG: hypothetical protein LCI00_33165 [Chloroflexi bacterium]|nr:hypothetical protein [Chloroflexota bacterium]MCC6892028.1 hypothetical protein [Anaerolineae bacterium]
MTIKAIELMDAVIANAQELLDDIGENEKAQRFASKIIETSKDIQIEFDQLFAIDGSLKIDPKITRHNTRAPLAFIFSSNYMIQKFIELEKTTLSESQLNQIDRIEMNVTIIQKLMDEICEDD